MTWIIHLWPWLLLTLGSLMFGTYLQTQSQAGVGSLIYINGTSSGGVFTAGTASTPTWTLIGEIVSAPQSGAKMNTEDATNMQSTGEEFIATIPGFGSFQVECNRVSADAGQAAVRAAFNTLPAPRPQFKVQLPKAPGQASSGDLQVFTAIIESFDELKQLSTKNIIRTGIGLKLSGSVALTVGS